MKLRHKHTLLVALATLTPLQPLFAGQSSDNSAAGGFNASVDLRHRVIVPQIIYFRLGGGGPGNVEKLRFDVNAGAASNGNNQTYSGVVPPPIGNGTPIAANGGGALAVSIYANVGSVNLSYDLSDPLGLSDGAGSYIPFDEIEVTSSDAAGFPAPSLENAGANGAISTTITGNAAGGRVTRRDTTWTFSYSNSQAVTAGTYNGRVRYTVSAP